jgi:ribonuclease P protein component
MKEKEREQRKQDKPNQNPPTGGFCDILLYMFQQENRLRKERDFNLVMKHGYWQNGLLLDIKILELAKNEKFFPKKETFETFSSQLKLAISVGLKFHKSAVVRNRVRRQIREVLRLLIKDDKIKKGYYILMVAKKAVLDKVYADISQEIKVLLSRAKVLK